jgi:methyl-accepting chemotaxis protein
MSKKILKSNFNKIKIFFNTIILPQFKNLKFIKNIKIVYLIIFIAVLSIISLLSVGYFSLSNMEKIKNNSDYIYNQQSKKLQTIDNTNSFLNKAFLGETKIFNEIGEIERNFFNAEAQTVISYLKEADDNIKTMENTSTEEKKIIKEITSLILGKINFINNFKKQKGNINLEIESQRSNLAINANIISKILLLKEEGHKSLTIINENNSSIFNTSKFTFRIIITIATILMFILSFYIIFLVRKSALKMIKELKTLSENDFTIHIDKSEKNEFGIMRNELKKMILNVSSTITTVINSSSSLDKSSIDMVNSSKDMKECIEHVAKSVENVSMNSNSITVSLKEDFSTIEEFTNKISKIFSNTDIVDRSLKDISSIIDISTSNVENMKSTVEKMKKSINLVETKLQQFNKDIKQINSFIDAIKYIAKQSQLLALNTAVQASSSTYNSKGFIVISQQLKKLSGQSKDHTAKVYNIVDNITKSANEVFEYIELTKKALEEQITVISESVKSFESISLSTSEIFPKIMIINNNIYEINKDSKQIRDNVKTLLTSTIETSEDLENISASAQELAASSTEVENLAINLDKISKDMHSKVNEFKIHN